MATKEPNGRMSGLKLYAEQRSREIVDKANATIDKLVSDGDSVTFEAVSKAAGVARGTLYKYPEVKERILKLKAAAKAAAHAAAVTEDIPARKTKVQRLEERIATLTNRVAMLEEDKKKLIIQLVDMEELKEENERLRKTLRGGRT